MNAHGSFHDVTILQLNVVGIPARLAFPLISVSNSLLNVHGIIRDVTTNPFHVAETLVHHAAVQSHALHLAAIVIGIQSFAMTFDRGASPILALPVPAGVHAPQ